MKNKKNLYFNLLIIGWLLITAIDIYKLVDHPRFIAWLSLIVDVVVLTCLFFGNNDKVKEG